MSEIILIRHGETEWSKTGQHTGKTDIPLTSAGIKQATLLNNALKKYTFNYIASSPRKRALETARFAGLTPEIEPDLAEWDYGDYEGKTSAEIGPDWNLFRDGAPNGESLSQVSDRADRVLKKIHTHKGPIAIFSHGHFSRILAARYLGLDASSGAIFYLSVASISILGLERKRPVLKLWNETCHL